jgi:hypothetical protein
MTRRFDIEPLSEARRARVERALFERLDREGELAAPERPVARIPSSRPIVVFVLAGAAAAFLGAFGWEALRARPSTEASHLATAGAATHVVVGESSLDVAPFTVLSFRGDDTQGIVIVLERGEVDCEVAPRKGRPPFVVQSGDVSVRVIGTHFRVSRDGDVTHVSVDHGIVEVDEHDHATMLTAGQTWPAPPPLPVPSVTASVLPTASAPFASTSARASSAPPTPSGALPPSIMPSASAAAREPSPRERYEKALSLESSQPDVALATYRELAKGTDPWAMNALFAEGRFEVERGHRAEARKLLDEYLVRFPTGPNEKDARVLRAQLE